MELADVEAFLVLADELHFGRAAERVHVTAARVSQRIQALEREVGGALFERTSRRVRLTPLGERLRGGLQPAYAGLTAALADARAEAREARGLVRIGFTATTSGAPLNQLVRAFEVAQPGCAVMLREVPIADPFAALRSGELDVVLNWHLFDAPDLTFGPVLARMPRMVLVAVNHPLAAKDEVSHDDLADYEIPQLDGRWAGARAEFIPSRTPSGRPIPFHPEPVRTINEVVELVARGRVVHPTVASLAGLFDRSDVVLVPAPELPPWPLGLIWYTAHENARIRALAAVAVG